MTKYPGTTTSSITFFSIIYKRSIDPSTLNRGKKSMTILGESSSKRGSFPRSSLCLMLLLLCMLLIGMLQIFLPHAILNYIGNPGGVSSMVASSTSNTNTMVGNMDSLKVHELYKELQNEKQKQFGGRNVNKMMMCNK